ENRTSGTTGAPATEWSEEEAQRGPRGELPPLSSVIRAGESRSAPALRRGGRQRTRAGATSGVLAPLLVPDDAGLGALTHEDEAALVEHADGRDESRERLGDDAHDVGGAERIAHQRACRLGRDALAMKFADHAVADFDGTVHRRALVAGDANEGARL